MSQLHCEGIENVGVLPEERERGGSARGFACWQTGHRAIRERNFFLHKAQIFKGMVPGSPTAALLSIENKWVR